MVLNAQELIFYVSYKQEKRQLQDILNIMPRSMSKANQADVPAIYPLKGEHKKTEHVKPDGVKDRTGDDEQNHSGQAEPIEKPVIEEFAEVPKVHEHIPKQGETNIYQTPIMEEQVKIPNPLLEPSSYPQVMSNNYLNMKGY